MKKMKVKLELEAVRLFTLRFLLLNQEIRQFYNILRTGQRIIKT
jgi:hypothetical protein